MKTAGVLVLALAFPAMAGAAAFFGTLTVDGRLPGQKMDMDLACKGLAQKTQVDERGAYRFVNLPPALGCQVSVGGASAPVVLYPNPTRYDFALTHPAGGPVLRQR